MENNQLFHNIIYVFAIDICFLEHYKIKTSAVRFSRWGL